jgi:hypothetical protein
MRLESLTLRSIRAQAVLLKLKRPVVARIANRPFDGGRCRRAKLPRAVHPAGISLQDAANSLLGLINSLFGTEPYRRNPDLIPGFQRIYAAPEDHWAQLCVVRKTRRCQRALPALALPAVRRRREDRSGKPTNRVVSRVVCNTYRDVSSQGGDLLGEKILGATKARHENKMCRMCCHDVSAPSESDQSRCGADQDPRIYTLRARIPCCRRARQNR